MRLIVCALLCACSNRAVTTCLERPEGAAQAALISGTEHAEYLALEPRQEAAVVAIFADDRLWCSGVLVTEDRVLSAKHCMRGGMPNVLDVVFGASAYAPDFETTAEILATHPTADVVVLALHERPTAVIDVEPLTTADALPSSFDTDSLGQLGGFGGDGSTALSREFLVAQVEEVRPQDIVVSAAGLGGACFGDSGGPLLARDDQGRVRTLGLLHEGSENCTGIDVYTRLDVLTGWLPHADGPASTTDGDSLGPEGRCFDAVAVWSQAGAVHASRCSGTRICGWSEPVRGYRCIERDDDTCMGTGELGLCVDGDVIRCEEGSVRHTACTACGFACGRSPKTGRAICLAADAPADGG